MDFKSSVVPINNRNTRADSKKRKATVIGEYPTFKVKLKNGDIIDLDENSIKINKDTTILYSTPSNDVYANYTKHSFTGTERLRYDIISNSWCKVRPSLKVTGNINKDGMFEITEYHHI